MWPLMIPVVDELLVGFEHPSFAFVCLMEGFDLPDR
jgi:hypothetical protein